MLKFTQRLLLSLVLMLGLSGGVLGDSNELIQADQIFKDLILEGVDSPSASDTPSTSHSGAGSERVSYSSGAGYYRPAQGHVAMRIQFDFDSARLTYHAKRQLDEVSLAMRRDGLHHNHFLVVGHTDAKGAAGYNHDLSLRRAAAVAAYLSQVGLINPAQLQIQGQGEGALLDIQRPYSAVNRRVEFINMGQ